jgi:acyl-coenzyme A synthetase/AMP-(fatty) acid ligase
MGRSDDVLNLGGKLKFPPDQIEARLRTIPGVIDIAVTSNSSDQAIDDLCIAMVIEASIDQQSIIQQVTTNAALAGWRRALFKIIDALPKTENGTLSRKALRQLFAGNV